VLGYTSYIGRRSHVSLTTFEGSLSSLSATNLADKTYLVKFKPPASGVVQTVVASKIDWNRVHSIGKKLQKSRPYLEGDRTV
jgi:hypothetical protein